MSDKHDGKSLTRRGFVKAVGVSGAAAGALSGSSSIAAQSSGQSGVKAPAPSESEKAREFAPPEGYSADEAEHYFVDNPASDLMVDILKKLDIDYLAINAGSSFRGLQESVVNYGGNKTPELITCLHEEQAVALAHGYAKAAGKPMAVACHGTVGLQHSAMAVYNAWCDRVPILIFGANHIDAARRKSTVTWVHSARDPIKVIRDYTKWDDNPTSLQAFSESLVRAYRFAVSSPTGPTAIVLDAEMQELPLSNPMPSVPELTVPQFPMGDASAIRETAKLLVEAVSPAIVADRHARTQAGVDNLIELAEILNAPVIDMLARMNFPNTHYLNHTFKQRDVLGRADVILGLEVGDMFGVTHTVPDYAHLGDPVSRVREDAKIITLGTTDLLYKSNYQDFQRYQPAEYSIVGDSEATLPFLIEEVRKLVGKGHRAKIDERGENAKATFKEFRTETYDAARFGWSQSPVSMARLAVELWDQMKALDWSYVSMPFGQSLWPNRIWEIEKHYQYNGHSGAGGIGYGAPAAVGAALAFKERGVIPINIQSDGDLNYGPMSLWTAAHHQLPLLSIMHNNGGYHQEYMHLQRMASRRRRGIETTAKIGNAFDDPPIDYASMAKSMGVWATGAITDPSDLKAAISKGLDVVNQGEPALIDVICQPR